MKMKIISCELFKLYIDEFRLNYENHEIIYLEIYSHDYPQKLNNLIQNEINKPTDADIIVLIYGICGNALKGIYTLDKPIIIPKFHDCSQILLGSMARFKELFSETLSRPWSCANYTSSQTAANTKYENSLLYIDLVDKYGIDDAKYIYEMLYISKYDKQLYINFNLPIDKENLKTQEYEVIEGSLDILNKIFNTNFDKDFLVLNKNDKLKIKYDLDEVLEIIK